MPKPKTSPYFRSHTLEEYESLHDQRLKTEEITEGSIYDGMSRILKPKPGTKTAEVVSMPMRVEEIQYERTRSEIARISMQLILLDKDFQPSITRLSTMTDGIWKFERPIGIVNAKPMKIGFLLPSLPDDLSTDPFVVASNDIRQLIDA